MLDCVNSRIALILCFIFYVWLQKVDDYNIMSEHAIYYRKLFIIARIFVSIKTKNSINTVI